MSNSYCNILQHINAHIYNYIFKIYKKNNIYILLHLIILYYIINHKNDNKF